ncbi:MAG: radical SAM protein [Candidatus Omnitrophota bacterium]
MVNIGFFISAKEKLRRCGIRPFFRFVKICCKRPFRVMKQPVLKVILGVTYECQCRCGHCGMSLYNKDAAKELSTRECIDIIGQVAALPSGFILFSFFGGEPLLRKDIHDLIACASARGLFCEIETNGILLDSACACRLKKAGVHHVFISIDAPDASAHDDSRGYPGAFRDALRAMDCCAGEHIPFSVSNCVSNRHSDRTQEIISLARKMKAESVRFLFPAETGNFIEPGKHEKKLDEAVKEKIKSFLTPGFSYLESTFFNRPGIRKLCPAYKRWFFYVSCYGEVQLCPYLPLIFGNVRSGNLVEILNAMWKNRIFSCFHDSECLINDPGVREYVSSGGFALRREKGAFFLGKADR